MLSHNKKKSTNFWYYGFSLCPFLLSLVFSHVGLLSNRFPNLKGDINTATGLTGTVAVSILLLRRDIENKISESVQKSLSSQIKILNSYSQFTSGELKHSFETMLTDLDKVYKRDFPLMYRNLLEEEFCKIFENVYSKVKELDNGISFGSDDSLEMTQRCMSHAVKNVFAISWPDIDFWKNCVGGNYLLANQDAITKNNVTISRFFVIRESDEDIVEKEKEVFFSDVLMKQVNCVDRKRYHDKMKVYLTHFNLIGNNAFSEDMLDISLYDDALVSKWIERENDRPEIITRSKITMDHSEVDLAIKIKKQFEDYLVRSKNAILITSKCNAGCISQIIAKTKGNRCFGNYSVY